MIRITNSILQQNLTQSLQQTLQRMSDAQQQVSTGQRYRSFADDPAAQSSIMQSSGALRAITQYRRNVNDATARSTLEDTVLSQLGTVMDRAKQIAVQEGTSTATAATRAGAKAEVDGLIATVVGLGNTQYAGMYLFGGDNATTAPVTAAPPFYTGTAAPGGTHTTEIAAGQLFKSNHNARELLLDSNVLGSLRALSDALGANDAPGIGAAVGGLDGANQSVQSLVGDLGARMNQLQVAGSNLDALQSNLTSYTSNLANVDTATAATELVSRQNAYQAAMLAASRVMGLTLTNYLK